MASQENLNEPDGGNEGRQPEQPRGDRQMSRKKEHRKPIEEPVQELNQELDMQQGPGKWKHECRRGCAVDSRESQMAWTSKREQYDIEDKTDALEKTLVKISVQLDTLTMQGGRVVQDDEVSMTYQE